MRDLEAEGEARGCAWLCALVVLLLGMAFDLLKSLFRDAAKFKVESLSFVPLRMYVLSPIDGQPRVTLNGGLGPLCGTWKPNGEARGCAWPRGPAEACPRVSLVC